ncbi:MAG: hypothetical protein JWL77_3527 [Chthonomonadaceae bacterium]|nr:hypothetical protein [Chthonomonadaceae bacterium]
MSEKPKKRLVSKGQYVEILLGKIVLYSVAGCMLSAGLFFLALAVGFSFWLRGVVVMPLIFGAGACAVIWFSKRFFVEAKEIEWVQPITVHNAHLLPVQETLVRPSDLPPSHQQAELLRAAPQGSETPPEELLRATHKDTNGQEE